jgi:transcriptional regulator with XRE-family HTH domain
MAGAVIVGNALGEWLADAIRAAGFETQDAFAEAAGLSGTQVSEYVRGRRKPSWSSLDRMAAVLQVPPGELAARILGGRSPETPGDGPRDLLDEFVADIRADAKVMADIRLHGGDTDEDVRRTAVRLMKAAIRAALDVDGA